MRIVVDARGLLFPQKTGIQQVTEQLLLRLVEDRESEYLIAVEREPDPGVVHRELEENAEIMVVPSPPEPRSVLWEQHYLPRAVERAGADLLYAPAQVLPCGGRFATVNTMHDASVFRHPECFTEGDGRYYRRWLRASALRADLISTISESSRRELLDVFRVPERKIRVVYPAVDHESFHTDIPQAEVERVRASMGIRGPYVLYLGALEPRKNVPRLIQAFAQVVAETSVPHTLVIAGGKAWLFEEIEQTARQTGLGDRIVFTGYVSAQDKPPLYAGADLFAYPSLYEGFGLPPVEAMACGTPALVGDTTSMPEVTAGAAILVEPRSVDSIADGLARALTDRALSDELARKGVERAAVFEWSRMAREMEAIFREAVG